MHTLFLFILFTCATHQLASSSNNNNRRILHEPFVPSNTIPPSQPPKPPPKPSTPNPKYPFSTTTTTTPTPNNSPFFPNYPSTPPPPSPPIFASFPANISSLILPHPPKPNNTSNSKLLPAAFSAVTCAALALAVSTFLYFRRRHRRAGAGDIAGGKETRKLRNTSSASSEFLYLGTVVNSRRIEIDEGSNSIIGNGGSELVARKLDSPELLPLPPLARQDSAPPVLHGGSMAEEEGEEEFYSPRGSSLGGSGGTGSGSRRAFSAVSGENFAGRSAGLSSGSFSSSNSGSPERCNSISLSPETTTPPPPPLQLPPALSPALSPIHNHCVQVQPSCSSLCSSSCSTPERAFGEEGKDTHIVITHSPLLSPLSLSPARELEETPDGALGASDVIENRKPCDNLDANACASSAWKERSLGKNEGASSSPPRLSRELDKIPDGPLGASDVVTFENGKPCDNLNSNACASSSSQERIFEKNEDASSSSPRLSRELDKTQDGALGASDVVSFENGKPCASSLSSQERIFEKNEGASLSSPPRISNASGESRKSMSLSSAFSLPSSPEKDMMHHHGLDQSPRMSLSSVSGRFRQPGLSSLPLSPTLLSSPENERELSYSSRSFESATGSNGVPQRKHWEIPVLSTATPTTRTPFGRLGTVDNVLDQIAVTPPPVPQRKHWEIPALSTQIAPSPPPPPPLPPLAPAQRQRRHWEVLAPSTPVGQPNSMPPELIPPSRPFVLQNTTKVSSVGLPSSSQSLREVEEASKPKLKPLHWDKVKASSDREMVWDQLKSSSFKLNEEMIETLFVVNTPNLKPKDNTPSSVLPLPSQEDRVLDPKKSQNIAILLRALNVTMEEVREALLEGSADTLGAELLESLLKMAPSKEEERKLKEHKDDSTTKLGPAEKFLKAVLDVPFAFKRVETMLYIVNFESEVDYLGNSFQTLEAACEELRNSRMFLKLLEAVLKTGNRMNVGTNRGDAQAFKLDTLLKLADVKGADGKTSLLHFVVQEIIRTEGARLSGPNQTPSSTLSEDAKCRRLGLQVVSSLSSELANVKKAAAMDSEVLSSDVSKLSKGIAKIVEVVKLDEMAGSDENTKKFTESMNKFIRMAEEEIPKVQAQESVAMSLVKEITEYFHGNLAKEEAHPFRIFMVVRDFLAVLDRVCKEVGMINERTMVSSAHKFPVPVNPMLPQPLPGLHGRRQDKNSSDDDSPSP